MLNDEFIAEEADHLASRIGATSGSHEQAVRETFALTLARAPTASETRHCIDFLVRQGRAFKQAGTPENLAASKALAQLCRTLYNTSEFLYSE